MSKKQTEQDDSDVTLDKFASDKDVKKTEVEIPVHATKAGMINAKYAETPKNGTNDTFEDLDELITNLGLVDNSKDKAETPPKTLSQKAHSGAKIIFSSTHDQPGVKEHATSPALGKKQQSPLCEELQGRGDIGLDHFHLVVEKLCGGPKCVMVPLHKLFQSLDKDKDNKLNEKELATAFQLFGDIFFIPFLDLTLWCP